jgi:hypothetical protein
LNLKNSPLDCIIDLAKDQDGFYDRKEDENSR